nr:odorant receptor [Semanotus bifasciatus]
MVQFFIYVGGAFVPTVCSDILYLTLTLLMKQQFQILNFSIKTLFPIGVADEEKVVRRKIKRWVDYHNNVLKFVQLFNDTYRISLFFFFGVIMLSTCIELFMVTVQPPDADNFKCYSYIFILFFMFCAFYCLSAQMVTNEAEKLSYNIWASGWNDNPSTTVKAAMNMILMRCRQPVSIRAGIVDANFEICLDTLKTVASYYTFLRTMNDSSN